MENTNPEELKKKLHELIDSIDDEKKLQSLNDGIIDFMMSTMYEEIKAEDDEFEDDLDEEQLKALDEAIEEADRGETMSLEEFKERMEKCTAKLKEQK